MKKLLLIPLICLLALGACKNEKRYIYEVEEQEIYQSANDKKNLKTTTQFISIAYNDLFGSNITTQQLQQFDVALQAFGDKNVIQEMIVKNLINRGGTQIPSDIAMRGDLPSFVEQTYLRIYNRKPNEFEAWKLKDMVEKNADITAKMVYYSLMTSEEYKYY
jgi:hypothetical protein